MSKQTTKEEHFKRIAEEQAYIEDVETLYSNLFKPITKEEHLKRIAEEKASIKDV